MVLAKMISLLNTLSKKKEVIVPSQKGVIKMYSCGPTVYADAHIGNHRSFITADILYRTFIATGYKVDWVMNITDIDDKTIKSTLDKYGPDASITDLRAYTGIFFDNFLDDLRELNISVENIRFIRVTDVIPEIQKFILNLIKAGYAYKSDDGSTYFSINKYEEKYSDYGQLVGESFLNGKKIGTKVNIDEYEKDNISDFVLWKSHADNDGNIFWDDEVLGRGRPGWHIECSAINNVAFGGEVTDIHTGGIDLVFPHHTNEIAQSRPLVKSFVNYWFHSMHMLVDNKKMSKSLGNHITISDIKKEGLNPLALRHLVMNSHYGKQSNFTYDALLASEKSLNNIAKEYLKFSGSEAPLSARYKDSFLNYIFDDLNTSAALAVVWELINDKELVPSKKISTIRYFDKILGLDIEKLARNLESSSLDIPEDINKLVSTRDEARSNKDWKLADQLREELLSLGFTTEDNEDSTTVKRV